MKIFSSFSKISTYKHEILLFLIIFTISSSIPIFQYSVWETSDERIKHQSLALFSGDEPFYFEITSSITRNHSLNLDAHFMSKERDPFFEFPPLFYEVSSCRLHHSLTAADGHCYIQNVGLPLILSPGYYIGGVVGSLLLLCTLLSIQGIVFYKISNHFTTKNLGLFLSILISLSTMLLSFSTNVYPDFMGGFFLLLILYFFFFRKNNFLNLTISGTLLAFLPFLKLTFLIFPIILLPIMTFVLLSKRNYNNTFHLIASFLILILIYYSLIMFIAPIEISPGVGGGYKQFFIDSLSSGSGLSVFLDNYINGLERYLFGQSYGLFLYSPLALLSIFGIKYIWNYNKFLSLSIIIAAFSFISAHSILAPFGGGWTLPGRYVIPILPILLISLFPLFEKFKKNIIFHAIILGCSYVGVSLNIIFARTIFGHFLNDERINILNPIYFGLAQVFPKLVLDLDKLWNLHVGPIFSIFIIFLFSVLIFFTFSSFFKKILLTKNKKILFFVGLCVLYGSIFYYIYDDGSKYYTESQVSELFDELLKRQPTNEEMNYWKNSLLTNTITSNEMRNSLINSDEGKIVNEISKIYKEILQREPDSSGLDHWKEKIINNEISFKELETIIRNSAEGIKNNAN